MIYSDRQLWSLEIHPPINYTKIEDVYSANHKELRVAASCDGSIRQSTFNPKITAHVHTP